MGELRTLFSACPLGKAQPCGGERPGSEVTQCSRWGQHAERKCLSLRALAQVFSLNVLSFLFLVRLVLSPTPLPRLCIPCPLPKQLHSPTKQYHPLAWLPGGRFPSFPPSFLAGGLFLTKFCSRVGGNEGFLVHAPVKDVAVAVIWVIDLGEVPERMAEQAVISDSERVGEEWD